MLTQAELLAKLDPTAIHALLQHSGLDEIDVDQAVHFLTAELAPVTEFIASLEVSVDFGALDGGDGVILRRTIGTRENAEREMDPSFKDILVTRRNVAVSRGEWVPVAE